MCLKCGVNEWMDGMMRRCLFEWEDEFYFDGVKVSRVCILFCVFSSIAPRVLNLFRRAENTIDLMNIRLEYFVFSVLSFQMPCQSFSSHIYCSPSLFSSNGGNNRWKIAVRIYRWKIPRSIYFSLRECWAHMQRSLRNFTVTWTRNVLQCWKLNAPAMYWSMR